MDIKIKDICLSSILITQTKSQKCRDVKSFGMKMAEKVRLTCVRMEGHNTEAVVDCKTGQVVRFITR